MSSSISNDSNGVTLINDSTNKDIKNLSQNLDSHKLSSEIILNNNTQAFNSKFGLLDAYKQILSVAEQNQDFPHGCIGANELQRLLKQSAEKNYLLRAYDGFEPSGRMHIAQGLVRSVNVNKLCRSGLQFVFLVADQFAQLNGKMGGDLNKIQTVGKYFVEVWRACGMDIDEYIHIGDVKEPKVKFVQSSKEIDSRSNEYQTTVMDIARKKSVGRIKRCGQIMGRQTPQQSSNWKLDDDFLKNQFEQVLKNISQNRKEDESLNEEQFLNKYRDDISKAISNVKNMEADKAENISNNTSTDDMPVAQLLYPLMQCTDIFFLDCRICQLGMDQLKVNVLAREYCDTFGKKDSKNRAKFKKPVVLSHHMLMGLKEGQQKMSKSDPESAIFMEDSADDVRRKIRRAFCRPGDIKTNPILDYVKHVIFPCLEDREQKKIMLQKNEEGDHSSTNFKQPIVKFEVEFQKHANKSDKSDSNIDNKTTKIYKTFEEVEYDFANEILHPSDIKVAVTRELNQLLEPVRQHFASGEPQKLLKLIKSQKK